MRSPKSERLYRDPCEFQDELGDILRKTDVAHHQLMSQQGPHHKAKAIIKAQITGKLVVVDDNLRPFNLPVFRISTLFPRKSE